MNCYDHQVLYCCDFEASQGVNPCDRRRSISEYKSIFPAIDFSMASAFFVILTYLHYRKERKILLVSIQDSISMGDVCIFRQIESDADILWKPNPREKDEQLAARGMKFLNWLWTRPEKEIAVVTHSAFLLETLSAFGNDCHPSIKSEICKLVEEEESFRKVVSNKSFIDLDSEAKEEDDDMAQNNNDLEDGFDGMEATNDIVEASKAKNNTEKEFEPDPPNQFFVECQLEEHGESKRRVEDDQ
ncbi:hypothetical protein Vadar_013134 [Vaccinium darrowii]|uniref:Uncharacterized protein n=1 Tax=Vaccinium darrowii TaxID=229202 RepID=A0ACB7Y814_9ERIC|nr:hypothetical protein Vadar_013134 [Vaccinium darrowii]